MSFILPKINSSSYRKNLGNSIKYIAIDEIKTTTPVLFDTIETNR